MEPEDRVQNSPSLAPVLSQINPAHAFLHYFCETHFNIIFPSTLRPSKWVNILWANRFLLHLLSTP